MVKGITCLLNSVKKFNIQRGLGQADVTLSKLMTKSGEFYDEIVSDFGKGLTNKSEVFANKIINTASDGKVTTYLREHMGTFVIEANGEKRSIPASLFQNIYDNIYKGLA